MHALDMPGVHQHHLGVDQADAGRGRGGEVLVPDGDDVVQPLGGERVEALHQVGVEGEVERGDARVELLGPARPRDDRAHVGVPGAPGERELGRGAAELPGDLVQLLHGGNAHLRIRVPGGLEQSGNGCGHTPPDDKVRGDEAAGGSAVGQHLHDRGIDFLAGKGGEAFLGRLGNRLIGITQQFNEHGAG